MTMQAVTERLFVAVAMHACVTGIALQHLTPLTQKSRTHMRRRMAMNRI
jgi:hypothetical protein